MWVAINIHCKLRKSIGVTSFLGVSPAAGEKYCRSNRKRNFVISHAGAIRRSKLILFVLVLVLENQDFIEDEDDDESRTLKPGVELHKK